MKIDSGCVNSVKNEPLSPATPGSGCMNEVQPDGSRTDVDSDSASSRKRKRKQYHLLSKMLNWVLEAAKSPSDPAVGTIPELPVLNSPDRNEFWFQALLAREALLKKQICSSAAHSIFQKKQTMHPSMYEDPMGSSSHQSTIERLRCSQRILPGKNSLLCSHSILSPDTLTKSKMNFTPRSAVSENQANEIGFPGEGRIRKYVGVGQFFQAEVPDWTGIPSESDSKWLGKQVWPPEASECYMLTERGPIGKGRQDSCNCQIPGSVECVRFHIAEKRMKLKVELGSAFYHWKFNCMGEEVSLSWMVEEENRFKAVVQLNPASENKNFWDEIYKYLPNKKRKELVAYYFNAFLLRCRGYQNRVTPNKIDSDDDESEFGSVSNIFGHEAVNVQNVQFIDSE